MGLRMIVKDNLAAPWLCCDLCGQPILGKANAQWRTDVLLGPQQMADVVLVCTPRCQRTWDEQGGNKEHSGWMSVDEYLWALVKNHRSTLTPPSARN